MLSTKYYAVIFRILIGRYLPRVAWVGMFYFSKSVSYNL